MGNGQSFTENEGDTAYGLHSSRSFQAHRTDGNENFLDDEDQSYDVVSFAEDDHSLIMKRKDKEAENRANMLSEKNISSGSSANRSSSSPTTSYTRYSQTNSVITFEDDDFSSSNDDTSLSKSNSVLYDTDEVTAMTDMAHDGDDERTKQALRSRRSTWSSRVRAREDDCVVQGLRDQNNEVETEEETIMIIDAEEEFSRCSSNNLVWQKSADDIPSVPATDVTYVAGIVEICVENQQTEESLTDKENSNEGDSDGNVKILVHGIQGVPVESNPDNKSCAQRTYSLKDKRNTIPSQGRVCNSQYTEGEPSTIEAKSSRQMNSDGSQQKRIDPVGVVLSGLNAEPNRNRNTSFPGFARGLDAHSEPNRNRSNSVDSSGRQTSMNRSQEGETSVLVNISVPHVEPNINRIIDVPSYDPLLSLNKVSNHQSSQVSSHLNTDVDSHRNGKIVLGTDDSDTLANLAHNSVAMCPEITSSKESILLEQKEICMDRPIAESNDQLTESNSDTIIQQVPLHEPTLLVKSTINHIKAFNAIVARQNVQVHTETDEATEKLSTIVGDEVNEVEGQATNAFAWSDMIDRSNSANFKVTDFLPVDQSDLMKSTPSINKDASRVLADDDFDGVIGSNATRLTNSLSKKKPTSPKPEDLRDRNIIPKEDNVDEMTLNEKDIDLLLVREYDEAFNVLLGLYPALSTDHPAAMEIIRVAKLQKILSLTAETESELLEYVQTLNEQKLEMTSHYHLKLVEASKKKVAREFYLQEELRKTKDNLFHRERRSMWDAIHFFRQLCLQYNNIQHYLLQRIADANDPLDILPESLAGNKKLLLDALLGDVDETDLCRLRDDNSLLNQQAMLLEQELASLQQKAMKNEAGFSWVSPFLCNLNANQFEHLRQRFDEQTAKSTNRQ